MSEAVRDENRVTAIIVVSMIDLATPVRVAVNPATNAVIVEIV